MTSYFAALAPVRNSAGSYARTGTTVAGAPASTTFTKDALLIGVAEGSGISLENVRVSVRQLSADTLEFGMGGETLILTGNAGEGFSAELDDRIVAFDAANYASAISLGTAFSSGDDGASFVFFSYGYNTAPAEVAARTGSALYSGETAALSTDLESVLFGEGVASLAVDFDRGSVSGEIALSVHDITTDAFVGDATLTVDPARIEGNSFRSTLRISNTFGADIEATGIEGSFHGEGAGAIGGTYYAVGTREGRQTLMSGAYVAEE